MRDLYSQIRHGDRDNQQLGSTWLLIVFFLVTSLCAFYSASSAGTPSPFEIEGLLGQRAPDFSLKTIDGRSLSLSSLNGSVVLLNFWATWCPPCREEMPSLDRLFQRYRGRGLVIIAVSVDTSPSTVGGFLAGHSVDFTVLIDYQKKVSRDLYKVFMMPTTFLIDRKGVIVERYFGGQDWTEKRRMEKIEALLGARSNR